MQTTTAALMAGVVIAACAASARAQQPVPDAIAVPGTVAVVTLRGVGTQIYDCKADAAGKLVWEFREPVATLIADGKTVGRHYAGPTWELADGSAIVGKVAGRAVGATAADIPVLKLDVAQNRGSGQLGTVTAIQRLNTKGGVGGGACEAAGTFLNVPYVSDYVFLKKGG